MPNTHWDSLTAADMMKAEIVSVPKHATAKDIETLLVDRAISAVAVRDDSGEIVGVVAWRDVMDAEMRRAARGASAHEYYADRDLFWASSPPAARVAPATRAEDIMNRDLLCVPESAGVREIAAMMSEYRIHRVFVKDDEGSITGILTALDVMDALGA